MGLTKEEYAALSPEEREAKVKAVTKRYMDAGADVVVQDIRGVLELIG